MKTKIATIAALSAVAFAPRKDESIFFTAAEPNSLDKNADLAINNQLEFQPAESMPAGHHLLSSKSSKADEERHMISDVVDYHFQQQKNWSPYGTNQLPRTG